jgi:hypothetical protein
MWQSPKPELKLGRVVQTSEMRKVKKQIDFWDGYNHLQPPIRIKDSKPLNGR